jgi:hypothetical protein
MSDSPLLNKMDALLKKHRGGGEAEFGASSGHDATPAPPPEHTPPPGAWLPVLTDVIERGTPPISPPSPKAPAAVGTPTSDVTDTLAEQLMGELAPRLSEAMEKQVTAELRKKLDQTVAGLLSQLDVNVREIVREAVAEKLRQPRDPST